MLHNVNMLHNLFNCSIFFKIHYLIFCILRSSLAPPASLSKRIYTYIDIQCIGYYCSKYTTVAWVPPPLLRCMHFKAVIVKKKSPIRKLDMLNDVIN